MNIGEASARSGVSIKMIRHYERIGLIRAAARTTANYRTYADDDVHRLRFIRRARDLGFPLARIEALLGLWSDKRRSAAQVKKLASEQIGELKARLFDVQQMLSTLEHLAAACHGDERPDCPILEDIADQKEEDGRSAYASIRR